MISTEQMIKISFLSSTLILDLLEEWQIGWYLHVNCDIDEHRHKLFLYNQNQTWKSFNKTSGPGEMVGSEVTKQD